MLDCIKTFWREYVRIKEDKEAFFHSCSSLLNSKHYHRLYRSLSSGKGEILYYSSEDEKIYLKIESSTGRSMILFKYRIIDRSVDDCLDGFIL